MQGSPTSTFTETQLEINGIETAVLTAGSGDPVVFLHGAGTATGFETLLPIAAANTLIVAHHPGFGSSGDPVLPGIDHIARHQLDVIDALGIDRFALAGHSMGGWMAATIASYSTARITRLALIAPVGLASDTHPTVDITSVAPDQVPLYLTADLSIFGPPDAPPPPPEFFAARQREAESYATVLRGGQPDHSEIGRWLHRIDVPTLLMWGDADRLVPFEQAADWAARLPQASIRRFEGAGHLLFDERPDAATTLAEFVRA